MQKILLCGLEIQRLWHRKTFTMLHCASPRYKGAGSGAPGTLDPWPQQAAPIQQKEQLIECFVYFFVKKREKIPQQGWRRNTLPWREGKTFLGVLDNPTTFLSNASLHSTAQSFFCDPCALSSCLNLTFIHMHEKCTAKSSKTNETDRN